MPSVFDAQDSNEGLDQEVYSDDLKPRLGVDVVLWLLFSSG